MIGVELFVEIKYFDPQGLNKTQIADRLGIDRKTVRKYVNQDVKSFEQESGKQRSILNPYKPYLTASSHFFQVINQAYERQSVIITSNRPFQEWSGVFHDAVIVTAILDRVLHHAHIFNMKGDSYRLREDMQAEEKKVMPLS